LYLWASAADRSETGGAAVEAVLSGLWFIGTGLVLHLELKHTPPVEQSRDNNQAARVLRSEMERKEP
jgi:hypothetical protein